VTPQDTGPRRRNHRKALRGVPTGRRATHEVVTTYGHRQRERDRLAAWQQANRPLCTRCEHPITTTPVVDPEDRSGRAYCSDDCRDADAEGAYEQYHPSGVAT
jgi:hypothetical protein